MGVFEDLKKKSPSTSSSGGGVFSTINKKKDEDSQAAVKKLSDNPYKPVHDFLNPSPDSIMGKVNAMANQIPPQELQSPAHNKVPKSSKKVSNYEDRKDDPSRQIPILGKVFQTLDKLSDTKTQHVIANVGQTLYTPGGGAANAAGLYGAAQKGIAKIAPNLVGNAAGRITQKAASSAVTAFPEGVGQYQAQGGDNVKEALKQGALSAALGGGLGALGGTVGELASQIKKDRLAESFDKMFPAYEQAAKSRNEISLGEIDRGEQGIVDRFNFMEKQTNKNQPLQLPEPKTATMTREAERRSVLEPSNRTILGRGDVETLALPESNTPRIISDIKKQANAIIKPPTSRRDLLAYTEQHLEIPRTELVEMTDKDLYQLGQMIRTNTNMDTLHTKLAAEQGHNWTELVSGKSVTGTVESPLNRIQDVRPPKKPDLIGSKLGEPLAVTKVPKVTARNEVAATTDPKVKASPVNGTVTKNETVRKPVTNVEVVGKAEPLKAKAEVQRTITPTQRVSGIRANYQNQLKNGNLSGQLKGKIGNADQTYEKVTNVGSVERANESVKNIPKAESDFLLNEAGGADHIATGYRLMQKLDSLGEHERALVVSKKLAEDLTKSGQTTQAASILSKLSPEGQLLNLVRQAEKNGKSVSVKDSVEFKAKAKIVQEKAGAGIKANQFTEILDRAAKGEKLAPDDITKMSDYLASAEKNAKPKVVKVADDLPAEFKDVRKRDKIVSFLDDAEQAALARIKARKNNLNSLPIGEWADHAIVVSAQIAKGSIKAATHIEDLVKLFGEEIRPVATQVYQKAQSLVKRVSPQIGGGDITKAQQAFHRLSGAVEKEKAVVQEMASHVKKLIADSKASKLDPADIQKLRDYSDEIAEMTADAKPRELPTQDQKFLQSVKLLSKKIAKVENEKIPMDQANKEISNLLRQVTKVMEEGDHSLLKAAPDKDLNKALSDIAYDVMSKTKPSTQEKLVEKYLRQQAKDGVVINPKDIDTLRELAKNVTRLSGSEGVDADIAMQKILNSYEKSTPWDKVQAVRYMSMLLNSSTQLVNAASGPIMATKGAIADVFGTMVDVAMHQTLKTPRSVTMYGTNPLRFMADYFKHLIKTGAPAGWHGVSPGGIQNAGEIRGLTFKSNYNPLNWAERTLGAVAKGTDYATYKTIFDSEIRKSGFLDALNSGIKRSDRSAIKAHVEKFVNEPTEDALLNADRIGKNTTFQRSDSTGGKVANFLASGPAVTKPLVGAVMPFVRTPINIASSAVSMTPAGILKGLWQLTSKSKASQREAIRTLSLGVTGTFGTSALGYYLSNIGVITGANDSGDKNVDAIREQAGKGKYRFNTSALKRYLSALLDGEGADAAEKAAKYQEGDHAFDYNKLQPLAFPLAIGASLQENKDKSLIGRLGSAGADAYGSLFGMSTLKGVQDVFQPQYSGTQGEKSLGVASRVAESFFKSFSPSMLAQEARRQDPIARKTPYNNGIKEDVKGYFKSRTPGLSQSLPANKTTLGIDKKNAAGFTGQYVNPYKSEIAAYSSAAVIISNLIDKTGDASLAPSAPLKNVKFKNKAGEEVTVTIPQDRYEQLQEELGHEIILKITALDPSLSDAKKAERIKVIYAKARKKEMDKVEKELKDAAK